MPAISDERNQIDHSSKKKLKNRLTSGTFALLVALLAVISATYAWYVYNTGRHTTKVRMAAGAGVNLQISNSYNGTYGSAAVLDSFSGQLNPGIYEQDQWRFPEGSWLYQRDRKSVQSGCKSFWQRRLQRLLPDKPFSEDQR